jgi:hypothetical protein
LSGSDTIAEILGRSCYLRTTPISLSATVISNSSSSFLLSISIVGSPGTICALVDSGASSNFIDQRLADILPLQILPLPTPVFLSLFDGKPSSAGHISHSVDTQVSFADLSTQELRLLVTTLHPSAPIVLGLPWLRLTNPLIDWATLSITFPSGPKSELPPLTTALSCYISENALGYVPDVTSTTHTSELSQPTASTSVPFRDTIPATLRWPGMPFPSPDMIPGSCSTSDGSPGPALSSGDLLAEIDISGLPTVIASPSRAPLRPPESNDFPHHDPPSGIPAVSPIPNCSISPDIPDPVSPSTDFKSAPRMSIIGAAAFKTLLDQGHEVFYYYMAPYTPSLEEQLRATGRGPAPTSKLYQEPLPTDEDELLRKVVPPEYQDFADVFSKSKAEVLPPHRAYDHSIPIEDDSQPPHGPIYPMSQTELQAVREYLEDMLGKGFIRSSSSPAGAPVLFAKKKDGGLRFCIDYRGLNRITRKNRYPLPLIGNLIDQLRQATVYTKLDLRAGYNNVRITPGEEWKTAFRTRYGSFEYLVMPFGLTNAPATFQHFMNDVFRDMVDIFVVVYLDDILIYSIDKKQHQEHVRRVLQRLREYDLHAKPEKCIFYCESVEFLGFIVSPTGVAMDPAKTQAIRDWPIPDNLRELQSFLGFCNFYRRFINSYSDITIPLIRLTRKDAPYVWSSNCNDGFNVLKAAFETAPILTHFDPDSPIIVEVDASDYAVAAILSQITPDDGDIHPIAFHSRSMAPAELNYEIYDKELLAIFEAFRTWRNYLEGATHVIIVLSDHKNLEYFTTTKQLTRRQARWAEFLCGFKFNIKYRPGKLGAKPDALTRRGDVYPKGGDEAYALANPQNFQSVFRTEQLLAAIILDSASVIIAIRHALKDDTFAQERIDILKESPPEHPTKEHPWSLSSDETLLLHRGRFYVPDVEEIRMDILRFNHDHFTAGHPGIHKTVVNIQRHFYWPKLRTTVTQYIRSCTPCRLGKGSHHKPYGPLRYLAIPEQPWTSISMDLIEGLPTSDGYDTILVIVCRMTKMGIFIPTYGTATAEEIAMLFFRFIFSKHGVPMDIVSDRGKHFISRFWQSLCTMLKIKANLSTAYHPETDGQTERVNQILEIFLRMYINYLQDDWAHLLPVAEFAYNNTVHSATSMTPFFANKGYHPKLDISIEAVPSESAHTLIADIEDLHKHLRAELAKTHVQYEAATANRRIPIPDFPIGSKVFLDASNIRTQRPTKKLDHKNLGPYPILAHVSSHAVRLGLPLGLRGIHPVFHVSLLEPETPNPFPSRVQDPPPPVLVDGAPEFEVEEIVDSKIDRRRKDGLMYRVRWKGYDDNAESLTWEIAANLSNAPDLIADFHARYPDKPRPPS